MSSNTSASRRAGSGRVYFLPMFHDKAINAESILQRLRRVSDSEGHIVVALEQNDTRHVNSFLRNLIHKSDREIAEYSAHTDYFGFASTLLKGMRGMSNIRRVYPIAPDDADGRISRLLENAMKAPALVSPESGLMEHVNAKISGIEKIVEIDRIREPLMVARLNELVATVNRPIAVVIGAAHVQPISSRLETTAITVLEMPEAEARAIYDDREFRMEQPVIERVRTNAPLTQSDYLILAKSFLVGLAEISCTDLPAGTIPRIEAAASMAEAEKLHDALRATLRCPPTTKVGK